MVPSAVSIVSGSGSNSYQSLHSIATGKPCATDHVSVQLEPLWYRNCMTEIGLRQVNVFFDDRTVKIS